MHDVHVSCQGSGLGHDGGIVCPFVFRIVHRVFLSARAVHSAPRQQCPCPSHTRRWFRQFLIMYHCLHKGGVDSKNSQMTPATTSTSQYANYWAPLTRKRHIPPHSAQPQHTNYWAPRTRKRHQQEHRPQRSTDRSDPTQHAKGRAGDCLGPHKETSTRRSVTQGGLTDQIRGLIGRMERVPAPHPSF